MNVHEFPSQNHDERAQIYGHAALASHFKVYKRQKRGDIFEVDIEGFEVEKLLKDKDLLADHRRDMVEFSHEGA